MRQALVAPEPPRYTSAKSGWAVDAYETAIRRLLRAYPTMPAIVIAERIGCENSLTVLKDR